MNHRRLPGPLSGWADRAREAVRTEGPAGVAEAARTLPNAAAVTALQTIGPDDYGTPVDPFDREWDVLAVCDACRADAMAAVTDGTQGFTRRETVHSPASQSEPWLRRVFTGLPDERIGYVTANPHSTAVDLDELAVCAEVWRDGWSEADGTVPPRRVTDRAVTLAREREFDRLVVHYMQPHAPYLETPVGETTDLETWGEGLPRSDPFYRLRTGDLAVETVWAAYLDNLRLVLEDVELLFENCPGERGVVTADHGEAFGESLVYGHPPGVAIPALRLVPWYEAPVTDSGAYEPTDDPESDTDSSVEDRLRALGYR